MKTRFCPGYHVGRTCDRRCTTCKHVIVRDLPPGSYPRSRRGELLPVIGRIVMEFKIIRPGKDAKP